MGNPTPGRDSEAPTLDPRGDLPADYVEPYPGYLEGAPPPDLGCPLPPREWYCSAPPGHEGPCPTRLRIELENCSLVRPSTVLNAYKRVGLSISPELTRDVDPQLERDLLEILVDAQLYNLHLIPAPRPWWLPRSLQTFLLGRLTKTVRCRRA